MKNPGETCTSQSECNGICINGLCRYLKGLNEVCELNMECTTGSCVAGICSLLVPQSCSSICKSKINGEPCLSDSECINSCVKGICLSPFSLYDESTYVTSDYLELEAKSQRLIVIAIVLVFLIVGLLFVFYMTYRKLRNQSKYQILHRQAMSKRIKLGPRRKALNLKAEIERQVQENNLSEVEALKKTTELLNDNLEKTEAVVAALNEKILELKSKIENYECKICYSKTISTVVLPCRHGYCSVCAAHCFTEREKKCAMCNQRFKHMVKLMGIDESDTNGLLLEDDGNTDIIVEDFN